MSESNDLRPVKKRGCFLTGVLVVQLIIGILGIIGNIRNVAQYEEYKKNTEMSFKELEELMPSIFKNVEIPTKANLIFSLIMSVALIITIILIFKWVKNAIYAYGAIAIINYLATFIFGEFSVSTLILSTIGLAISILIAYFLLKALNKYEEQMAIYEKDTTNY